MASWKGDKMYILDYFKYVIEHKKNVFKMAWKRGLYIHAFTHDLSKFGGSEFLPYAKYFYKDKDKYKHEFKMAWRHHYLNNPHHWQYWLDKNRKPREIPNKYLKQMIVDWEGMALKFGDTSQNYYLLNYNKIKLTDGTRMELEFELRLNLSIAQNYGHTLKQFYNLYSEKTFMNKFSWIEAIYDVNLIKLLNN